jgi:hypothetical protein
MDQSDDDRDRCVSLAKTLEEESDETDYFTAEELDMDGA